MLISVVRMTSAARKPSGRTIRLTAESSRVRSNHWLACVCAAFYGWEMRDRVTDRVRDRGRRCRDEEVNGCERRLRNERKGRDVIYAVNIEKNR